MTYLGERVEIYVKDGSTWSTTPVVLTNFNNLQTKRGAGKIKNSFSFNVIDASQYYLTTPYLFAAENLVKIYQWRDATSHTNDDLIMNGIIRAPGYSSTTTGETLSVKGDDFSEVIFDREMPIDQVQKTFVEIIQWILGFINTDASKQILWDPLNPTVKNDTTSFPKKDLILNYTRIYEMLDKLMSDQYTEDGNYVWWVRVDGTDTYLSIRYKDVATEGTITQGVGTKRIKINKAKDDVRNFIVFNAGTDLRGNPVEDVVYDVDSIAKFGFKTQYYTNEGVTRLFTDLWNRERSLNTSVFVPDSDDNPTEQFPDTYPYTMANGESVSTDFDFNNEIRNMSVLQGKEWTRELLDLSKNPRYEAQIDFLFNNTYALAGVYNLIIPARGWITGRKLRIEEINHIGGMTELIFKEDETLATAE